MLAAALAKKIRHHKILCEDEITSIVFGEMRYLPPKDSWSVFSGLLSETGKKSIAWPELVPDRVEFSFWPRSGNVEPDVLVKCFANDSVLMNFLVEIKWDAKLSSCCQLIRQWALRSNKQEPWVHLYVVKNGKAAGFEEIEHSYEIYKHRCRNAELSCCDDNSVRRQDLKEFNYSLEDWQSRLFCVSWLDIVSAKGLLSQSGMVWLAGVRAFLERLGIVGIHGFDWLETYEYDMRGKVDSFYLKRQYFDFLQEVKEDTFVADNVFYTE